MAPLATCAAIVGCTPSGDGTDVSRNELPFMPEYQGIETVLLDDDLVNFLVSMRGARDNTDVGSYARCAAAQYALIRGFGFARHVRTQISEESGLWQADAVYTISSAIPDGLALIDAEVTVDDCTEQGIPTV
jgi:hypothetical protein